MGRFSSEKSSFYDILLEKIGHEPQKSPLMSDPISENPPPHQEVPWIDFSVCIQRPSKTDNPYIRAKNTSEPTQRPKVKATEPEYKTEFLSAAGQLALQILGLDGEPLLRPSHIKKAYRRKARSSHPDLNPTRGNERQFQEIKEAHDILMGEIKRMPTASCGT